MPDDTSNQSNNQSNNQSGNQSNNQQQQNTGSGAQAASGKKIVFGADNGCQQSDCDKFIQILENCGNTVEFTCIDPNQEAYFQGHGADMGVFFCNGVGCATIWSFSKAVAAGSIPYTIFAFPGWETYHNPEETDSPLASFENVRNEEWTPEWDAGQFMNSSSTAQMQSDGNGAKTLGEYVDANSDKIGICWGASLEELAQNICNGACGGGGSGGAMANAGGGAQIKDKTFEKCIRRICAATDSIFLVENNAAVLFPYTDWMAFTLRQKINTIKTDEIDPDVFSMEYGNDGFYNKVSIAWGGGTLPDRFPSEEDSKKQVAQDKKTNVNYTVQDILKNMSLTNFTYDSSKAKQQQEPSTNTTKKDKTTQKISVDSDGTTMLSEQYDSLVEKYGEMEKRVESAAPDLETAQYIVNALLIQYVRDFNSSCRCRALNIRKYIGGTFYAVENPSTKKSEMFYLNGYTIRTQKGEPLYHDLEFKYGPEGAEEILDYQTLSGGAASGGTTNVGGGSATEQQIWEGAKKACHQWTCGELRVSESDTQDPKVAEDYYNKMVQSGQKFCLTCYGMSAWLYYQFNYKANIPCQVVGNSGHHVVMVDRGNGMVETVEEYRQLERGYRWSDQGTNVLLPAPSGGTSSGGNTSNNNSNSGNNGGSN